MLPDNAYRSEASPMGVMDMLYRVFNDDGYPRYGYVREKRFMVRSFTDII